MKVSVYPADNSGCGHYRMIWPGRMVGVLEPGVEVTIGSKLVSSGMTRAEADVVVFQRVMSRKLVGVMQALQERGIKVVVDIDDDFSCLHAQHPSRALLHPRMNPETNWRVLQAACAQADLVTTSTPELAARYGRAKDNAVVLPNCIPDWMLGMERKDDGRTVGWSGFVTYHPGDLDVTHGGVGAAVVEQGARFHVIGSPDAVRQGLGLGVEPTATGPVPFKDFHGELGALTVGIVPLADTAFNQAKSWLKGLEYAAAGVPFVASSTTGYRMLEARGAGVTVRPRAREWRREVKRLLRDGDELARSGRKAAEQLTMSKNAWRWAEAWASVL